MIGMGDVMLFLEFTSVLPFPIISWNAINFLRFFACFSYSGILFLCNIEFFEIIFVMRFIDYLNYFKIDKKFKQIIPFVVIMGVIVLVLIFLAMTSHSQGLITSNTGNICENEDYFTSFEQPITCCDKQVLIPGISLEKFWTECATPNDTESNINDTLWRVYACIVDKHFEETDKGNLTLENFAHVMTMQYPIDIRIQIFDKICKSSELAFANSKKLDALKGIRRKYYEIEMQVCAKKNASIYMQKMKEYPSYEQIYMRGGQCLNKEIPIHPKYFPRAPQKDVFAVWTTLLETVSENDNKNRPLFIQEACDLYSSWIAQEIATTDEIFGNPDFQILFNRIKPSWANKNVTELLSKQVDDYLINSFSEVGFGFGYNKVVGANKLRPSSWSNLMRRKLIEDVAISGAKKFFDAKLKFEFVGIRDEPKAKAMMVSCLIPTFMKVSIAESFTYLLCRRPY